MQPLHKLDKPTQAIVHYASAEGIKTPNGLVHYHVYLDPQNMSPSGDFIRLNHSNDPETFCELNGWQVVDELIIDEILTQIGKKQVANG